MSNETKEIPSTLDAIVIGAGPAGTAAAALLAEQGRRVALLEKDRIGRYKVGESLIPYCWHSLERLGLVEAVDASGFVVPKHSVQFASIEGKVSKPYYFFDHTDHPCAKTWQVVRREFDQLLLDNAIAKGAVYSAETEVREFLVDGTGKTVQGVRARRSDGKELELVAPVTIDASGRDSFAQVQNGWRVPDEKLRKLAIWTYYEGARRDEGVDEGTTTIAFLPEQGWFWYIPLPGDRVSVGVVAEKEYLFRGTNTVQQIFDREVRVQRWIAGRLESGRQVDDLRITSDFSYRARHCAANGLVLVGDAFAFLDPVFSSGVYFALRSGVMAADAVQAALEAGDCSAGRFAEYGDAFRREMEPMRRLVHAFYDGDFNFGQFLKRHPNLRSDLTDCLIGHLDRDFDAFFEAVGDFAELPAPLPHGGPLL